MNQGGVSDVIKRRAISVALSETHRIPRYIFGVMGGTPIRTNQAIKSYEMTGMTAWRGDMRIWYHQESVHTTREPDTQSVQNRCGQ